MENPMEKEVHGENRASRRNDYKKVTVGGWLGTIVLSAIPGLNLIMWIVWACTAKKPSRKTFSLAMLILTAVFAVLLVLSILIFGNDLLNWARTLRPELFVTQTPVA